MCTLAIIFISDSSSNSDEPLKTMTTSSNGKLPTTTTFESFISTAASTSESVDATPSPIDSTTSEYDTGSTEGNSGILNVNCNRL